jgi:hypothetical protein
VNIEWTHWGGRRHLLSLFSPILFSPVVSSSAEAATVLELFEQKRLAIPLFLASELEHFARKGEVNLDQASSIVHTYFVGRPSYAVQCILDPTKLKRDLEVAQEALKCLKKEQAEIENCLQTMTESHPELKSARAAQATEEENCRGELARQQMQIESLGRELKQLEGTYPEEVLKAAQYAEDLFKRGGIEAFKRAEIERDTADNRTNTAKTNLLRQEAEIEVAEDTLKKATERKMRFLEETADHRRSLSTLIAYVTEGGPDFMAKADEVSRALVSNILALTERSKFRFDLAQAYIEALSVPEEERRRELDAHMIRLDEVTKRIRGLDGDERRLVELRYQTLDKAKSFDHAITGMVPSYKALCSLLHDPSVQEDMRVLLRIQEGEPTYPVPSDIKEAVENLLSALMDIEANQDRIISLLGSIKASFEGEHTLKDLASDARSRRKTLIAARERFHSAFDSYVKSSPKGIIESQLEQIRGYRDHPDGLSRFQKSRFEAITSEEEKCRTIQARSEEAFAIVKRNLSGLIQDCRTSLNILRRVLATFKGATYEVDVSLNEDVELMMGKLVNDVRLEQERLEKQKMSLLGDSKEERDSKKSLLEEIRYELYRGIFSKPRIRIYFPAICGEQKVFYSDEFSTGEKMAMGLLWLCILAEFSTVCAESEFSGRVKTGRQELGPSVFWIDGLFSHLSHVKILRDTLQSKGSRGAFQMIGLMHDPARLLHHDFNTFPRLFVTQEQAGIDEAGYHEWAVNHSFKLGQVDSILAVLSGSGEVEARNG